MEIRLASAPGEIRIALLKDDTLLDVTLWRPGAPDGWGDVHVVRITAHAPHLGGAFVGLTGPTETGFMKGRKLPAEGSLVCAQVTRSAQNGKGLRLRALPVPDGVEAGTAPRLITPGPTPLDDILRQAPDDCPLIVDDAALAARLPASLHSRLKRVSRSFNDVLEADWAALTSPDASVGPLIAHITPTHALTAIDLDAHQNPDFAANLACFGPLLREIRLRNLSGTLLIDPAGVRSSKRPALVPFLRKAADREQDPLQPRITGITPSGLLEMTRPRHRAPLHELYSSPHGQGLVLLQRIVSEGLKGNQLHAPPAIIRALEADPVALEDLFHATGQRLTLHSHPVSPSSCWSLS
ncbi:ribonuclease E/G [Bombella sp. TMW 2.2559]|uniref:Ribonuclease E/G n=1 Tax=Bombella dulcis TaxID=2967339 RepID=A0ABT3WFB4_9PROT|nr:ribonuclease E/G [Bombella dulcis]MCX5616469.1 ribonuclease E/G [Bombella dulcis]